MYKMKFAKRIELNSHTYTQKIECEVMDVIKREEFFTNLKTHTLNIQGSRPSTVGEDWVWVIVEKKRNKEGQIISCC